MPPKITRCAAARPRNANRARQIGAGIAATAASAGLLAAAAPAAADTPSQLLKQGSTGHDVAEVQRALHLDASGRFGPRTKRAVIGFQRRDGLLVDGIVGPQTWDALFGIAPAPAQSSPATAANSSGGTSSSYSSGGGGYTIPSSIVQCESGGSYSAVNASSGAGGAYQILPSTWQAYGGQGLPQNASKAEQDAIAARIYATQGRSAWSC